MYKEKSPLQLQVYQMAHELKVDQVAVRRIILSYLDICREDVLTGHIVRFLGLATLVPNPILSNQIKTGAYYCKLVSEKTRYPYFTVQGVMSCFFERLRDGLYENKPCDLRRLCTLHPVVENGVVVSAHVSISRSIKEELYTKNSGVISVRAHTCKLLRHSVTAHSAKLSLEGSV